MEKFFDRVNHDVLMARVARKVVGLADTGLTEPTQSVAAIPP